MDDSYDLEEKMDICERVKHLKHVEFRINDTILKSINQNSKEYIKSKVVPPKIVYDKKEMRKRKSVARTEKHKIAIAMAKMKNQAPQDELIDSIRGLLAQGMTQKEVCEELGIYRDLVSKVKLRYVMKQSEVTVESVKVKMDRKNMSFENDSSGKSSAVIKTSIAKRKINPHEMKRLLEEVVMDPLATPTTMSRKSEAMFGKNLSVDVMKSVMHGITKPFDQEFEAEDFTKEEYEKLLETIKSRGGFREAQQKNIASSLTGRRKEHSKFRNASIISDE